jgi:lipid-A-disaccharide synthase
LIFQIHGGFGILPRKLNFWNLGHKFREPICKAIAMKLFFSVGEPSGDVHGANLIRAMQKLDPQVEVIGLGGPQMTEVGAHLQADLTQLAVMGFLAAILKIHRFAAMLWLVDKTLRANRPDAVVMIDFPGFNWWVARRAKAHGIPVFYYGTPQVWAWAQWRVKKMRRLVDHVLCKLPFEVPWYESHGVRATYVGHPFFDEVRRYQIDRAFMSQQQAEGPLVALLPGSRTQEVVNNFRWQLRAAMLVHQRIATTRFAVAAYRDDHAAMIREIIASEKLPDNLHIEVFVKRTPELIHLAECCISVSGSVSLELLHYTKPTVIVYRISPFMNWLQSHVRKVKFITLVNLFVAKEMFRTTRANFDPENPGDEHVLFPEYVTTGDVSRQMSAQVIRWLEHPTAKADLIAELETLREQVGAGGASQHGAEYILNVLNGSLPAAASSASRLRAA